MVNAATREQAGIALAWHGLWLLPEDPGLKASWAQGLVLTGQWSEAQGLLATLAKGAQWDGSFTFLFAAIVAADHAKEALAVLEQAGAHESWRPLYDPACRRRGIGEVSAPGRARVRVVAEEILREIAPRLYET